MDTGATLSAISRKLARKLQLTPLPNSSIKIKQLDGICTSIGRVRVKVKIKNVVHEVDVHIIDKFDYPFLIGLDIGKKFGLQLDLTKMSASISSNRKLNKPKQTIMYLSEQQDQALKALLKKHYKTFSKHDTEIGKIKLARHSIITRPHPPIQLRHYRRSQTEYDEIDKAVQELLKKGLIRESTSPWAFPVIVQRKKDGSIRLCIDFRRLNEITIDDKMPIPRIDDIIDRLRGAKYFTTLDVAWGYWHIEMDPESIEKTAFVTNRGHYEWLVMPFGLKNAPATFQRIIQQVLGKDLYNGAINYLDDVILYSETFEEHMEMLDKIMQRFADHGIKLRMSKCSFAKTEVTYLGHRISHNEVKPSPEKTQAIREFPVPKSLPDLRRFLGLSQYYRRFIENFGKKAKPLFHLFKKDVPFEWGEEQQASFDLLVEELTKPPVLAIYDPTKPCIVYTDASKVGVGAALTQVGDDGQEHPVEYFSKQLHGAEQNYSATELECFAIVCALEQFHVYLNLPFTVITDHSALQWLFSLNPSMKRGRLLKWSVFLSSYDFKVLHRPGAAQQHVDALSRAPIALHLSFQELRDAQSAADLTFVRKPVERGGIVTVESGKRKRAVVPESLRSTLLHRMHDEHGHPGRNKTIRIITEFYWWPSITKDIKKYVESCETCQKTKVSHQPTAGKYVMPEHDLKPLERVGLDTIVMGKTAEKTRHKYIQVFIDHHSRYVWAFPTASNTTEAIRTLISNLLKSGLKFDRLLTDCHKSFVSKQLRRYLRDNQIGITHSTSYRPQTNGMVEKANGTIASGLRSALLDNQKKGGAKKWSSLLPEVVRNYNRTPHDITGFRPEFLLFGIDSTPDFCTPDTPAMSLEHARELANQRTREAQLKRKARHDEKHPEANFEVGDMVLRQIPGNHPDLTKLSPRWQGPFYIVAEIIEKTTYEIVDAEDIGGEPIRAHVAQLKRYFQRE